jgi:GTP cyclohydrolase III
MSETKTTIMILEGMKSRSLAVVKRCTEISAELNQTAIDISQNRADALDTAITALKQVEAVREYCENRVKAENSIKYIVPHFDVNSATEQSILSILEGTK